ncbi:CBS domain-containing protein [Pedobacter sp. UC225_65]|uniref:CBS domain-containing protein n=1 Tax=Pedobacter sp. UC225_65 TaxID=3350173 RepID=UPI00367101B6
MLAGELISNIIPTLKTSDTVQKALERMSEFKLYHLPIVNEAQFLGLVAEDELIEIRDQATPIGSLSLSILNPFVFENAHIYDVVRLFNQLQLSLVPVLDMNKNYLGVVSIHNLLAYTADMYALKEPGGILF